MSKAREYGDPRWIESREHWRLDVRSNGKRKSFYSSNPTRKGPAECRRKADEWLAGIDRLDTWERQQLRVGVAWEGYSDDYKRRFKISSWKKLNDRYKAHLRKYEHRIVSKIDKLDWQKLIDDAFDNGAKSFDTLKGIASTIKTFAEWCAKKGIINDDQVPIYFDYPPEATTGEKDILQPPELKKLFSKEAEDTFYIHIFRFYVTTGLRRGELPPLQVGRDYDGQAIWLRETLSHEGDLGPVKSKKSERALVLSDISKEQIINHQAMAGQGPYVFMSDTGGMLSARAIGNHWRSWRARHGIKLTLHELRHTFISYSRLKTDISLPDLKEYYGHTKSMDTDKVYVHPIDKTPEEIRAERELAAKQSQQVGRVFETVAQASGGTHGGIDLE